MSLKSASMSKVLDSTDEVSAFIKEVCDAHPGLQFSYSSVNVTRTKYNNKTKTYDKLAKPEISCSVSLYNDTLEGAELDI